MFEKTKINLKEAEVGPFKKISFVWLFWCLVFVLEGVVWDKVILLRLFEVFLSKNWCAKIETTDSQYWPVVDVIKLFKKKSRFSVERPFKTKLTFYSIVLLQNSIVFTF